MDTLLYFSKPITIFLLLGRRFGLGSNNTVRSLMFRWKPGNGERLCLFSSSIMRNWLAMQSNTVSGDTVPSPGTIAAPIKILLASNTQKLDDGRNNR